MGAGIVGWIASKISLPPWVAELALLALSVLGVWLWHMHTYNAGVSAQIAKDKQQNALTTARLETKAANAEHQHDDELKALRDYRAAHPQQPVRVCIPAPAHRPAAETFTVSVEGTPSAQPVQPVPAGDPGLRSADTAPDIGGMLEALAGRADQVAAQARELQSRSRLP